MITLDTLYQNPALRKGAGWRGAVTHCRKAHAYTPQNTIRDEKGCRTCRACQNARIKAWRDARRAS